MVEDSVVLYVEPGTSAQNPLSNFSPAGSGLPMDSVRRCCTQTVLCLDLYKLGGTANMQYNYHFQELFDAKSKGLERQMKIKFQ